MVGCRWSEIRTKVACKRLGYRATWQQKRRERAVRQRTVMIALLLALALFLLIVATARRPRAAATYRLMGRDISWLAAGKDFLLVCQREGRLIRLTSAMTEAGCGWARPFTHPAGFYGRPTIAQDFVLVSCADGRLRALDVRTGEEVWARIAMLREVDPRTGKQLWGKTADGTVAEATAAGGAVFFGADNGWLYAANLRDGKPLWEVNVGAPIASAPLVTESEVIVGTIAGVVHCVNRGDGQKRWRFPREECVGPIYASPRAGVDCILVGSDDGKLYSLSPLGELRGTYELQGLIRAPVAVEGGTALVGDSSGWLAKINTGGMSEIWRRRLSRDGGITLQPIVGADKIWCAAGRHLLCLRKATGRVIWRRSADAVTTDCIRSGESLYWATADGLVRRVSIRP